MGVRIVDRPHPASPAWLTFLKQLFGDSQLVPMTAEGERGIVCQMDIAPESLPYLRVLEHPQTAARAASLQPLLSAPPAVTLQVTWQREHGCWASSPITAPERTRDRSRDALHGVRCGLLEHAEQIPLARFAVSHIPDNCYAASSGRILIVKARRRGAFSDTEGPLCTRGILCIPLFFR